MHKSRGFTLIELLMVITIVGILAAIGTSSFRYVTTSNRIASEVNGLLGDLQFARSQAVKTGGFVSVCPSSNSTTCMGGSTWTTGWIVFLDLNGNGVKDAADLVVRAQGSIAPDTLVSNPTTLTSMIFNREGFATTGLTAWGTVILNSNPVNTQWRRCLAVSAVGALTVEQSGASQPTAC